MTIETRRLFRIPRSVSYELPGWMARVLRLLGRHRIALRRLVVGTIAVGTLIALLARPLYEATATVSLNPNQVSSREDKTFGRPRPEQLARPQIVLLESESVIRSAVETVGVQRLYPRISEAAAKEAERTAELGRPPRRLFGVFGKPIAPKDQAFLAAQKGLRVRAEPNTELIQISFRHTEPAVALEFTNALLQAFTERYYQIYSSSEALAVMREQQKRYDGAFEKASAALARFSGDNRIFLVGEQRRLLLERRNNLAVSVTATKGLIADKESQAQAIPQQLAQMKPIGRLSQVTGLTALSKAPSEDGANGGRLRPGVGSVPQDPPLLLVRVYQDTIAALVKLQSELAGLRTLVTHQEGALKLVDVEFNALSQKEAEFERLRLDVAQARQNAEQFMKRTSDEEFYQELNARKLSSVQVLQSPTMPFMPSGPRPFTLLAIGLFLTGAAFLFFELLRQQMANDYADDGQSDAGDLERVAVQEGNAMLPSPPPPPAVIRAAE